MRINRVVIRNFRTFEHLDISLANNISCVIGENNTGKSAFLHAIRLCIDANLSSAYRTLSLRDVSASIDIGKAAEVLIGLEITDYAKKINEEALVGAWSVAPNRARLIYRFRPRQSIRERLGVGDPSLEKLLISDYHWELQGGGDVARDLADIEWDEDVGFGIRFSDLQAFQVVFLPALRDVESDLRQPRLSPFVKLVEATNITEAEKKTLVTALQKANGTISSSDTIKKLARAIDTSFNEEEKYPVACCMQRQIGEDQLMVNMLRTSGADRELVKKWMRNYGLFQGIEGDVRNKIAMRFLTFAS